MGQYLSRSVGENSGMPAQSTPLPVRKACPNADSLGIRPPISHHRDYENPDTDGGICDTRLFDTGRKVDAESPMAVCYEKRRVSENASHSPGTVKRKERKVKKSDEDLSGTLEQLTTTWLLPKRSNSSEEKENSIMPANA
ncbi:hypothetical protein MRX96_033446 [Rhipicephalus microplus]